MVLSVTHLVVIVLACVSAYFGVKWLFRVDTAIENRRREAAYLAAKLSEMGFKELPEVFMNYAVGDYSGMASQISIVIKRLRGNDKDILADLSDVFDKLLKIKLAMAEGRMMVRSELETYERMLEPAPAVVAPAVVAPAVVAPDAVATAAVATAAVAPDAVAPDAVVAPVAPVAPAPQVIVVPIIQPVPVEELE